MYCFMGRYDKVKKRAEKGEEAKKAKEAKRGLKGIGQRAEGLSGDRFSFGLMSG